MSGFFSALKTYLFVYVLGGVTFLPLAIVVIFFLLPNKKKSSDEEKSYIEKDFKVGEYIESCQSPEKVGLITVMSKFNKSILTGKHQKNTGLESLAIDSSLYSRLKSNNKFLCQLKNNKIVLYSDDIENSENIKAHDDNPHIVENADLRLKDTRKVITLGDCYVTLWPPNLREGALFTKKSSILIIKKSLYDPDTNTFKLATKIEHFINNNVFFLQFDNNFDKEDWFFAILQSQKHHYEKELTTMAEPTGAGFVDGMGHLFDVPPPTFHFQTKDVAKLIALNNADSHHINCKWFNAILSRVFMASKANNKLENIIKEKIKLKLSKVNIAFLDEFVINDLKLGNIPPLFSNPKVVKMDLEGDLEVHVDILYDSNFTLNISTILNILNKPYTVELKLDIKKVRGTLIFIFKKPPSNRLWYTFKTAPFMELDIEPVIVNKSISYNKILKTLKNKILDAFKDVLVYPNFEDVNYYKMANEYNDNIYKGGLWDFTGFKEAFAKNESDMAEESESEEYMEEEIVAEEVVMTARADNDNEKASVFSTGTSAQSSDSEQSRSLLKDRRTFKDILKRSSNTFANDNSSDSHDAHSDISSNTSSDFNTNKVTSKFTSFYQKAKKSASTIIDNMKPDSETNLNDENENPVDREPKRVMKPVERETRVPEKPVTQIPKLPKRRPLPPIPTSTSVETIQESSFVPERKESIASYQEHIPVPERRVSISSHQPHIPIPQIPQQVPGNQETVSPVHVQQIKQNIAIQHTEVEIEKVIVTENKSSIPNEL